MPLYPVYLDDGSSMFVTEDHEILSAHRGWQEVQHLVDEELAGVAQIESIDLDQPVTATAFDLTVVDGHNYLVAGTVDGASLVAHNTTGNPCDEIRGDLLQQLSRLTDPAEEVFLLDVFSEIAQQSSSRRANEFLQWTLENANSPESLGSALLDLVTTPQSTNWLVGASEATTTSRYLDLLDEGLENPQLAGAFRHSNEAALVARNPDVDAIIDLLPELRRGNRSANPEKIRNMLLQQGKQHPNYQYVEAGWIPGYGPREALERRNRTHRWSPAMGQRNTIEPARLDKPR